MGKSGNRKKKSTAAATSSSTGTAAAAAADPDPSVFLKRAHELKEEGNRLFSQKDFDGALRQYELGLKLLPRGHAERALFHSNRAACLLSLRPVDHEAVAAECSLALQSQPRFPRALLRRARALDALRRPDLALQDVRSLLSFDPDNSDALLLLRKLQQETLSSAPAAPNQDHLHSRPSPAALGASAVRGVPIAGLGPCLPARPVKKPPSPSPPPIAKPERPVVDPPVPLVNGAVVNAATAKPPPPPPVAVKVPAVRRFRPLKLVYDHDIRLAQMPVGCRFRELREVVRKRFPSSKSVLVKYKDSDGDLVTVTCTSELRLAESSVGKKDGERDEEKDELPVLRLHVVEVSLEQEPTLPEEEEAEEMEEEEGSLVNGDESVAVSSGGDDSGGLQVLENEVLKSGSEEEVVEASAPPKEKDGKKECDHADCKEVEIDDWLFEFAQLFRQQVGIDPDAHLDLHELGMELCSEALEETVTSEDAQGLFDMAAAKFQEVAALAFFNWGNVHMCAARKKIPLDESSPKEVMAAQLRVAYDWVRERYALAGEKYEEALRIKEDFYEGLLALGQQHFETAKLHWSYALANKVDLTAWDSSETLKLFDSAEEKMRAATEMWEKVEEQRISELKDPATSKKEEILKKRKKQGGAADGQGEVSADEAAEQAAVMRSQIHLFWGNMLFERSQVEFKLGFGDSMWKKNLDAAVERFKLAGASEADISVVLKNHASNATSRTSMECDEKNVTSTSADTSERVVSDEDKHVLDN
ncbi:HSP-interacting protein [Iris pallida]|uniref:HSP-interacting protein n=1 Tax=Iris pallida TaxID=29817 RepID=A0AAX6GL81_IRIPA|nr:HSP-interacting protein [Iris pallida]